LIVGEFPASFCSNRPSKSQDEEITMPDQPVRIVPEDDNVDKFLDHSTMIAAFGALIPEPVIMLFMTAYGVVLGGVGNDCKMKRFRGIVEGLAEDLRDHQADVRENYLRSDEFEELFQQTLERAVNERNDEKRSLYGKFLLGAITAPDVPYDEQIKFLRTLDVLQWEHIRILKAILQPPDPNSNIYMRAQLGVLADRLPDIPEDRLRELTQELADLRVAAVGSAMVTGPSAVNLRSALSAYGNRFVEYLKLSAST
jgi:hypothetical protein